MSILAAIMLLVCVSCTVVYAGDVSTIDISPLREHDPKSIEYLNCAGLITEALATHGLFLAVGHGLESSLASGAFEKANELFSLPGDEKKAIKMGDEYMRGYIGFGDESGLPGVVFEQKEGFAYGFDPVEIETSSAEVEAGNECKANSSSSCTFNSFNYLKAPNIWPKLRVRDSSSRGEEDDDDDDTSMRSTLYDLYEKKVEIARLLSDAIVAEQESSRGVDVIGGNRGGGGGLTKESLAFGHEISVMRVFHYLATDTDGEVSERNNKDKGKDVLGSSAHTDWGLLTLIMQDEVGGLQFIDRSSPTDPPVWTDVPSGGGAGALVVNGGDFLRRVRPDLHSPVHRVVCPRDKDRTSFVFFYYPSYETALSAVDTVGDTETVDGAVEHNTLGNTEIPSFGEYIIQKWNGVQSKY